ncbi:TPA: hypothetical protein EYP70_07740, partial [Candidatus Bathyarchaeota archaeon]|nr:hypothetical protein [Candidatus Bathyarchaeota archaeon]
LMMKGFREALDELIKEKVLVIQDNFLKINEEYIKKFRRKRIFIINVLESLRKRIIRYILAVFPRIIRPLIMEKELYMKLTEGGNITSLLKTKSLIFWDKSIMASPLSLSSADDAMIEEYLKRSISEAPIDQLEDSEKYIYVETPLGPVAFSERITIDDFLKRIIPPGEPHAVLIRKIGGVLNTVYMIDVKRKDREEIYVVKIFKDWYGLKWFPLALWSFGTRGFSVLGRSRLEREFAVNRYLKSKGINVPRILYVSPKECMIFEEFVEGQNLTEIIRNLIISKGLAPSLQEIIRKVGAEIARIHSLGVSLGDCKPENILVCKDSRICFLDLEQASKGGDKAWDLAEFLYYSGHYVPPFMADVMKSIAREFCEGYLKEGGEPLNLKKARSLRYVKVFSFFTPPNIVFAVREACREILNTHITN